MTNPASTLSKLLGQSQDKAKRELRALKDYRATVVDVSPDGTVYVDVDGGQRRVPCASMASASVGDRVTVRNIDNRAYVTGNISVPSASQGQVNDAVEEMQGLMADVERLAEGVADASEALEKAEAAEEAAAQAGSDASGAVERVAELEEEIEGLKPDSVYVYYAENESACRVSARQTVLSLRFTTIGNTRVVFEFTVPHSMNLDGNVIARVSVLGQELRTVRRYEARGDALLSFMWSYQFSAGVEYTVELSLETEAVVSQIRENDADNATLWNRTRATSVVTWDELLETGMTWDDVAEHTWDYYASGSAKAGTWDWLLDQGKERKWDVVQPSTARPTLTIEAQDAQMVAFGRNLVASDGWDGETGFEESFYLSTVERGLSLGFRASLARSTATPIGGAFSESVGLSATAPWLVLAPFSEGISYGEDVEGVWASDLSYDPSSVTASGRSWTASSESTVTTRDFGLDMTVSGITAVMATVSGDVMFSASFDGGQTWLAYDGGWSEGTMTAAQMSVASDWPGPPARIRMEMPAGSSVLGMNFYYERS